MKKTILLIVTLIFVSCVENRTSNPNDVNYVEVRDTSVEADDYPMANSTNWNFDFSSYHLYTSDVDKYDESGYQQVSASISINESSNKVTLKLYDRGADMWFPFEFRIYKKRIIDEEKVTYYVINNNNQNGFVYINYNYENGLFVDVNSFYFNGESVCCWMQSGDSSGSRFRETGSVSNYVSSYTEQSYSSNEDTYSPRENTYESFSPQFYSGSIHSDEEINEHYYNYEETENCVEGVVVYEGDNDYYIVGTRRGYTILERRSGSLYEGHKVRGELNRYGSKYLINRNRDSEVRVYIENYALSEDDALEWMGENEHLKDNDQEAFDNR